MSLVFVYGSLRKGGRLNGALEGSEFLGMKTTLPEFSLYSLGAFPAMVKRGSTEVLGELYEVSGDVLADLDRIEGHPHFYRRTPVILSDGTKAETYLLPSVDKNTPEVVSGDWIKFSQ